MMRLPPIRVTTSLFLVVLVIASSLVRTNYTVLIEAMVMIALLIASDALLAKITKKRLVVLDAIISALILVCVLSPTVSPVVWMLAPIITSLGKRLIKIGPRHIFNPAALGIVALSFFFPGIIGWWIGGHWLILGLLIIGALVIWYRLNKWQTVAAFAVGYYLPTILLFGLSIVIPPWTDPTVLFFAGLMLVEPITSSFPRKSAKIVYGAIVGVSSFALGFIPGFPVDLFLAGLLMGNLVSVGLCRLPKHLMP